jgi:hypothetical protein
MSQQSAPKKCLLNTGCPNKKWLAWFGDGGGATAAVGPAAITAEKNDDALLMGADSFGKPGRIEDWLAPTRNVLALTSVTTNGAPGNGRSVVVAIRAQHHVTLHKAINGCAGRIIIGSMPSSSVRPTGGLRDRNQLPSLDDWTKNRLAALYSFFRGIVGSSFMLVGTNATTPAARRCCV